MENKTILIDNTFFAGTRLCLAVSSLNSTSKTFDRIMKIPLMFSRKKIATHDRFDRKK